MLHETIGNDDFMHNTALQHSCDIVSNSYNTVPTLQRCAVLIIVIANCPVYVTSPLKRKLLDLL